MKVYDCFTFFNELDLLEIRMNLLSPVVDYFVVVEGTKTHAGLEKNLLYYENQDRYKKFAPKIIYICVDDFPIASDAWVLENYQRNAIMRGLVNCADDDIIMISDCDEIPRPSSVGMLKQLNLNNPITLPLFMCYYYMNYLNVTEPYWHAAKAVSYKKLAATTPQQVRFWKPNHLSMLANWKLKPGWHMSYLNGPDAIKNKVKAFAHQEYNSDKYLNEGNIKACIEKGSDIFGRPYEYAAMEEKDFLPQYIYENKVKYNNNIYAYDELPNDIKERNKRFLRKINRPAYFISVHFKKLVEHYFRAIIIRVRRLKEEVFQ